jgi:lipid II:glycine glycyltransferase (peptidoglycan interpeptide bridge formation enzyme)
MSVFLLAQDNAYYHLSAVEPSCMCANGNYFILDHAFDLSKDRDCGFFILGGGRTSKKDDDLLQFKRKFSDLMVKFYIGGQIFNEGKYEEYADRSLKEVGCHDDSFFLKWRYSDSNVI